MNKVFIIGNGFDLNLGLETDYPAFYEYYLKQSSPVILIDKLKEDIDKEKFTTWADLEKGLGIYASNCSKNDFLLILKNIRYHLTAYLKKQNDQFHFTLSDSFLNDILIPERHLDDVLYNKYQAYRSSFFEDREDECDIISFNYTYSLESILGIKARNSIVNIPRLNPGQKYGKLVHVHGILDNELTMGVNDPSQIYNKAFKEDEDIIELFVKPEYNDACLNGNNSTCETLINNADVIILFGVSLGESDDKWWKLIGEQVAKRRCVVISYKYDEKKDVIEEPNMKRRWAKSEKSKLKKCFGIEDKSDDQLLGIILVGINKPFFKNPGIYPTKMK